jgi:hypothetical protein
MRIFICENEIFLFEKSDNKIFRDIKQCLE